MEISCLRSEVLALESRTPPHYQDKDFRESQKILRTKIESLETIVQQCEAENQELLEQRDADRSQVLLNNYFLNSSILFSIFLDKTSRITMQNMAREIF